jgi:TPR repeat protein
MSKNPFGLLAGVLSLLICTAALAPADAEEGPLSPENADATFSQYRFRCSFSFLCPFAPDVWSSFRQAMTHHPADQYMMGMYLITGDKVGRDERGGQRWYGIAALEGYPRAALELNSMRRSGTEMIVDEPAIAAVMKAKADANDPDAMRALSGMYLVGRGVDRDPGQALALLRRAAAIGSNEAEQDLARLLLGGQEGVTRDTPEALRWLAQSGAHGNAESMLQLSNILLGGLAGAEKRPEEGYRWLVRAAMLDEPRAQEKLSQVLASGMDDEGHGLWGPYDNLAGMQRPKPAPTLVAIDLVEADKWLRIAARNPWYNNPQNRAVIEPRMTSAQLKQAEAAAAGWHRATLQEVMTMDIRPAAAANR